MARGLDPLPAEEIRQPRPAARNLADAFGKQSGRRPDEAVSFNEYLAMLADRPEKFRPEQVGYGPADSTERCGTCFHFFRQSGGSQRTVCEILRLPDESNIDPTYKCWFQTVDGEDYPLLKSSHAKPKEGRTYGATKETR